LNRKQENTEFHHALKVVPDLCIGCTHCMKACPTEAIRVRNGLAEIMEERCVDCGECYKSCPVSAIIVEQDDFNEIFNFKVRVALVPSVLIGQFPSRITTEQIFGSLITLGFTHIFEIDSVVDIVQEGYNKMTGQKDEPTPRISSFCPAILRLIQVRFPSLVENLIRVKPPSDIAALSYKSALIDKGLSEDEIGLFYITPCAAKIASVKSPVGEKTSTVHGVINMEYLYNKMLHIILNGEASEEQHAAGDLTSMGILWSLTRGESRHQAGRSLAIDGISNVTHFLENLEDTENSQIDFLELRACDESCAGGALISGNRFLTVERLNGRARIIQNKKRQDKAVFQDKEYWLDPIPPRPMMVLDNDREEALRKLNKIEDLLKILPGIDCAACGSPTCRALAGDIVRGDAGPEWCVFLQELYLRNGKISLDEADRINSGIWGSEREYRSQIK